MAKHILGWSKQTIPDLFNVRDMIVVTNLVTYPLTLIVHGTDKSLDYISYRTC